MLKIYENGPKFSLHNSKLVHRLRGSTTSIITKVAVLFNTRTSTNEKLRKHQGSQITFCAISYILRHKPPMQIKIMGSVLEFTFIEVFRTLLSPMRALRATFSLTSVMLLMAKAEHSAREDWITSCFAICFGSTNCKIVHTFSTETIQLIEQNRLLILL